eukprot:360675-Chlamydomonas_euryale.AAC.12
MPPRPDPSATVRRLGDALERASDTRGAGLFGTTQTRGCAPRTQEPAFRTHTNLVLLLAQQLATPLTLAASRLVRSTAPSAPPASIPRPSRGARPWVADEPASGRIAMLQGGGGGGGGGGGTDGLALGGGNNSGDGPTTPTASGGSLRLTAAPFVPTTATPPTTQQPRPLEVKSKLSELVAAAPFVPGGGAGGERLRGAAVWAWLDRSAAGLPQHMDPAPLACYSNTPARNANKHKCIFTGISC